MAILLLAWSTNVVCFTQAGMSFDGAVAAMHRKSICTYVCMHVDVFFIHVNLYIYIYVYAYTDIHANMCELLHIKLMYVCIFHITYICILYIIYIYIEISTI